MTWRLAKSLETLRMQINDSAPGRSKVSDGTVGDAAHASRSSDHNPWVKDGKIGVVTALDITHDPKNGVDGGAISEALKASGDARLKYIIWNRRIWNQSVASDWRPYAGKNPHDKHVHISVSDNKARYDDTRPWNLMAFKPQPDAASAEARPIIYQGVLGQEKYVDAAKAALIEMIQKEQGFGPLLDGLVRGFQKQQGLTPDGKIGAYSWPKLI